MLSILFQQKLRLFGSTARERGTASPFQSLLKHHRWVDALYHFSHTWGFLSSLWYRCC
ncbi:uncharacterized protein DS421_19g668860 [Arachis hypogaea]|uniref:Uncharacterized protein n=1 Tax=Arachis hypogaea TaxID=3818 RepID=A0A6B9VD25_ARAHY|nr:uncharacterized protein DS421_19g668860 [Arachis hypogaea]